MYMDKFYSGLANRIKTLRENEGLTQEKLAEKAEITLDYMGKIETQINKPGIKSMYRIATALGLKMKDLFDFDY